MKKAGISWDFIDEYCEVHLISTYIKTLKNTKTYGCLKDTSLNIRIGADQCHRYNKVSFDLNIEKEKEVSDFLNNLVEKVNNKKNEIQNYCQKKENHIIEIKDLSKRKRYIRKVLYDKLLSENISESDFIQTNDIFGKELIVSKKDLCIYEINPPLIKIYDKKNSNLIFILITIKDIQEILNKFKYIRQEEIFKGNNKNGEKKEEKYLLMDLGCTDLPKIDTKKLLYSVYTKTKVFELIKNNMLNILNKDCKDLVLYKKKNNFIPASFIDEIKERYQKIKNKIKKIKLKVKDQINKNENIIIGYEDIFGDDNSTEYILININENNPEENEVVNKKDLYNLIQKWDNLNKNIIINNESNNKKIEINPTIIKISTLVKENIPEINQDETKDSKEKENEKIIDKKDEIDKGQEEKEKKGNIKERLKLRINPINNNHEKTSYTIRRAVIRIKRKNI